MIFRKEAPAQAGFFFAMEVISEFAGGAVDHALDVFFGFVEVEGGHVDDALFGSCGERRFALLALGGVTVLNRHIRADSGKSGDDEDRGHLGNRGQREPALP